MILIRYPLTCNYNFYNPIEKRVNIRRDMVFDESNTWNWQTKDTKEGEVIHTFVDHDRNEEYDGKTNDKGIKN